MNTENYTKKFITLKSKALERRSRNLSLQQLEKEIITDFLNENDVSIYNLVMNLLLKDEALPEDMVAGMKEVYTRSKFEFLTLNDFTFNYKSKYDNVNFAEELIEPKNAIIAMNLLYVVDEHIGILMKKKGFHSYIQYFRHLFKTADIYPDGFYEELEKHIMDSFKDEKTEKEIKRDLYEKKRKKQKDMNYLSTDDEKKFKPITVPFSKFEKEEILDPFLEKLQKKDITLSQLSRYEMMKLGLISQDEANIDKKTITKCKNFKFKAKLKYPKQADYKKLQKESKKNRINTAVYVSDIDRLNEKLNGIYGTFIKEYVLKKNGAYPSVGTGRDVSIAFIIRARLIRVREALKELNPLNS